MVVEVGDVDVEEDVDEAVLGKGVSGKWASSNLEGAEGLMRNSGRRWARYGKGVGWALIELEFRTDAGSESERR